MHQSWLKYIPPRKIRVSNPCFHMPDVICRIWTPPPGKTLFNLEKTLTQKLRFVSKPQKHMVSSSQSSQVHAHKFRFSHTHLRHHKQNKAEQSNERQENKKRTWHTVDQNLSDIAIAAHGLSTDETRHTQAEVVAVLRYNTLENSIQVQRRQWGGPLPLQVGHPPPPRLTIPCKVPIICGPLMHTPRHSNAPRQVPFSCLH